MAGITKAQAQTQLDTWLAADAKVAKGQSISVGGRSFSMANAAEIRQNITYWDNMVRRLSRGGRRVRLAVPRG